mmetsp:Transcript_3269/g.7678  ORF Transcript_3269/g.7678 Transcript_3269/m.7678 type:complete len:233 (-) Transcript_3269:1423-2121(-)
MIRARQLHLHVEQALRFRRCQQGVARRARRVRYRKPQSIELRTVLGRNLRQSPGVERVVVRPRCSTRRRSAGPLVIERIRAGIRNLVHQAPVAKRPHDTVLQRQLARGRGGRSGRIPVHLPLHVLLQWLEAPPRQCRGIVHQARERIHRRLFLRPHPPGAHPIIRLRVANLAAAVVATPTIVIRIVARVDIPMCCVIILLPAGAHEFLLRFFSHRPPLSRRKGRTASGPGSC